jgi:TetR/AcrR family transcriptional repressor of nem operon
LSTRERLLDSAIELFMRKGFIATSIDEICRQSGTTKGAFFHHFESKEQAGLLALERFGVLLTTGFAKNAEAVHEPVGRLFAYIDGMIEYGRTTLPYPTCLVSLLTLEMGNHPPFRAAAEATFGRWLDQLEPLFDGAIRASKADLPMTARDLAEYFLATTEGSLILARARNDRTVVEQTLAMFRDQLSGILERPASAAV